jgi:hypothetical protein
MTSSWACQGWALLVQRHVPFLAGSRTRLLGASSSCRARRLATCAGPCLLGTRSQHPRTAQLAALSAQLAAPAAGALVDELPGSEEAAALPVEPLAGPLIAAVLELQPEPELSPPVAEPPHPPLPPLPQWPVSDTLPVAWRATVDEYVRSAFDLLSGVSLGADVPAAAGELLRDVLWPATLMADEGPARDAFMEVLSPFDTLGCSIFDEVCVEAQLMPRLQQHISADLQRATGAVAVEIERQFQALLGDQYAPGRTHQDLHDMLVYGVMGARDLPGRPGIVAGGRTPVVAALVNHTTRVAVDFMYGPRQWPVKHARTVAQHALRCAMEHPSGRLAGVLEEAGDPEGVQEHVDGDVVLDRLAQCYAAAAVTDPGSGMHGQIVYAARKYAVGLAQAYVQQASWDRAHMARRQGGYDAGVHMALKLFAGPLVGSDALAPAEGYPDALQNNPVA